MGGKNRLSNDIKYFTIINSKGHATWKSGEHYNVLLTAKWIMDLAFLPL